MNGTEINEIFESRYNKAMLWVRRFKIVYFVACVILVLIAISMIWVFPPLFFFIIAIPAICYPLLHFKLFNRWAEKTLRNILNEATETTMGTVSEIQGIGLYQINYSYVVDGKKIKAYDLVSKQQALSHYKGLEVPVHYIKRKPSFGYLEI